MHGISRISRLANVSLANVSIQIYLANQQLSSSPHLHASGLALACENALADIRSNQAPFVSLASCVKLVLI